MDGLKTPWIRRFQILASQERRIQAGRENVGKEIAKFMKARERHRKRKSSGLWSGE
jgi:hypothetical protein